MDTISLLQLDDTKPEWSKHVRLNSYGWGELRLAADVSNTDYMQDDNLFGIEPFYVEKGIHFHLFIIMGAMLKSDFLVFN